jgi:hypothetical protein
MAHPTPKSNCQNCKRVFHPDHRNMTRQRFCSKPECRHASKVDAQRRWRQQPDNLDYFKGSVHVERVQQWRREHPGYWRRQVPEADPRPDALQETLTAQEMETQTLQEGIANPEPGAANPEPDALQDSFFLQPTVLVGLIAQLTGLALQEDIALMARRLQQLGRDILQGSPHTTGGSPDAQMPDLFGQATPRAAAIQLGGSALGP